MPSFIDKVRDLDRLRQIVGVLARNGFFELVQRTGLGSLISGKPPSAPPKAKAQLGERIRLTFEELGPSFVKLGQIISTRPDLIPGEIVEELKKLQDEVAPVLFGELRGLLEEQLGRPVAEVYAQLEETPLASASIGQVHRAKLRTETGLEDVVVKIQRPNIKSIIERDMDLLYWLAHTIERSIPESHIYSPVKLVAEFDRAINAELDFALEADNADRFAKNFRGSDRVVFPTVFRDASSRVVITLGYLNGQKVLDAVHQGYSGESIARTAIATVIEMIFEHGFFHADPHPGNILIMGDHCRPVIGLVDLGQVGRLSPRLRDRFVDFMVAVVREDQDAVVEAICTIGTPTQKIDRDALASEVARLSDKYLGKRLRDVQTAGLLRDLGSAFVRHGLEIPSEFLMMGKTLMTMEGIGRQIYPELDLVEVSKPHFLKLLEDRYSPEKLSGDLIRVAARLSTAASTVPIHAQEMRCVTPR
jgi:ubiquinone biosynthesis protein